MAGAVAVFWGLQTVRSEVSFWRGLSSSQDMGLGSPPSLDGKDHPGTDPSCPAAVPFPMCHPSLAAWELKISERQGITGCLNISCL